MPPSPPMQIQFTEEDLAGMCIPQPRKGRPSTVLFEVVRGVAPDDLPAIAQGVVPTQFSLMKLNTTHHEVARLLALGKTRTEVALISGYTPEYVGKLQDDPAFAELLEFYARSREEIFLDAADRMQKLGIATLDELQARLVDPDHKWANRELMELAKILLVDGKRPGQTGGGSAGPGGAAIAIQFVAAPGAAADVRIIEGEIK